MKKICVVLMVLSLAIACKQEPSNFARFAGKITNLNPSDSLISLKNVDTQKQIKIAKDGSFNDTINVSGDGYYTIVVEGKNIGFTYLKNGYDLFLEADKNSFFESSSYSGKGANSINYLLAHYKLGSAIGSPFKLFSLQREDFDKRINQLKTSFDSLKEVYTDVDKELITSNDAKNEEFFSMLEKNYEAQHDRAQKMAAINEKLAKGNPSPAFKNYTNYKGGTSSLANFKGKYVYIDVWATWCTPCIGEIPSLQKLEKKYHNKNIEFISISIDDKNSAGSWESASSKWKKMIRDKNLTGTQLFAGKDTDFLQAYNVSSIPRFILIDPDGKIIDANAPRPSDPSIEDFFKEAGI